MLGLGQLAIAVAAAAAAAAVLTSYCCYVAFIGFFFLLKCKKQRMLFRVWGLVQHEPFYASSLPPMTLQIHKMVPGTSLIPHYY